MPVGMPTSTEDPLVSEDLLYWFNYGKQAHRLRDGTNEVNESLHAFEFEADSDEESHEQRSNTEDPLVSQLRQ